MKNCDEMVNSLFERRDRYAAEQKRKRKMLTRTATSMFCLCLVALLGFGIWRGGMLHTTPPDRTVEDALYPGIKDYFDERKDESPDNPAANNKIIVHQIDGWSADRHNICLLSDDFVVMDKSERMDIMASMFFQPFPMILRNGKISALAFTKGMAAQAKFIGMV